MSTLAEKGTLKALLCPVLSRKASAKGTHKSCIEWWVVGAQVVKVRVSLLPPEQGAGTWKQHRRLFIPDENLQLDGGITSCSKKEQVFPSLRDKLL